MKALTGTLSQVQNDLAVIDLVAAGWWASQGYTVIDGVLIGKNALTGEDDARGVTTTWDIPTLHPDGFYYIADPADDPRFVDWRDYVPEGVILECAQQEIEPLEI